MRGCASPPTDGRLSCPEHRPIYDRVREELAQPRRYVVRGSRALCSAPGCSEPRVDGARWCEEHDGDD